MEKIDIKKHARDTAYYNRDRDMETALVWNALKKTLKELSQEELFPTIKSVKIGERTITITTERPLMNNILKIHQEILLRNSVHALKIMNPHADTIGKISFR